MALRNEKFRGFTIKFQKIGNRIYATFKSAPKHIGSVDTYRAIGVGFTKKEAFGQAKDHILMELEALERAYSFAPGFEKLSSYKSLFGGR